MVRGRIKILLILLVLPFVAVIGRLWSIQTSSESRRELVSRALIQHIGIRALRARRGVIRDRHGAPLAINESRYRLVFVPAVLDPVPRTWRIRAICEELQRADPRSAVSPEAVEALLLKNSREHLTACKSPDRCKKSVDLIYDVPRAAVRSIEHRVRSVFHIERVDGSNKLVFDPHEAMRVETIFERLAAKLPGYTASQLLENLRERRLEIDEASETELEGFRRRNPGEPKSWAKKGATIKSQRRSWTYTLVDEISMDSVTAIEYAHEELPGIDVQDASKRRYPAGPAVGPLVGYLVQLSRERLDKLRQAGKLLIPHEQRDLDLFNERRAGMLRQDSLIGLTGLEREFDDALHGMFGLRHFMKTRRNDIFGEDLGRVEPVHGGTVHTTIDLKLQKLLYKALGDRVETLGSPGGSAIVIELGDQPGAVLAAVGVPSYDPELFFDADYRKQQESRWGSEWQRDRPFLQAVTPGSVFKIVSAIALLESGGIDDQKVFSCGGMPVSIGNREYRCHDVSGHGGAPPIDLRHALRYSCNSYFYQACQDKLGLEHVYSWASAFGFGRPAVKTGTGRGTRGILVDPIARGTARQELGAYLIGQQFMTTTPAQVVRMAAAIALDGRGLPHLYRVLPEPMARLPEIRKETIRAVQEGMERVTQSGGTFYKGDLVNYLFAAKTGTAQITAEREEWHAWVCGYGPVPDPKFAFAVCIEESNAYGGTSCAPVVEEILGYLSSQYPELRR